MKLLFSFFIFLASFYLIIQFLPARFFEASQVDFTNIDSQFQQYVVPFDVVFKKTESTMSPTKKTNFEVAIAPRSEIKLQSSTVQFFSKDNNNYSSYTNTATNTITGEIIYKTDYLIENNLRRIEKVPVKKTAKISLVFVGCSFTFGEGVDFINTLPGRFEKNYPNLSVYSLGIGGMALNDQLFLMQNKLHHLNSNLGEKIILIYSYMEDHIFRESCSTACLSPENSWRLEKPRYEVVGENLVNVGKNSNKYPYNWFTRMIFGSKLMQNRHFPQLGSDENFTRHQKILSAFYEETRHNQNIIGAYDFMGFGNSPANINALLPYVTKTAFKPIIIDYYNQPNFKNGLQPYIIPYDGHPSALGYAASYEAVLFQLKKDFPDIF